MSKIDIYTKFISEQAKSGKIAGLRSIREAKDTHILVQHPYTAHESGEKGLLDHRGELTKKGEKHAGNYEKLLHMMHSKKPEGVRIHDSDTDEDAEFSVEHGSPAHKMIKSHLSGVSHGKTSADIHNDGYKP
jgi:hypothetical protein